MQNVGANYVHDVKGTKFEGTKELFNVTSPDTACYCPGGHCEHKHGVRNVTACVKSPVFVSFPHFYEADKSYRDAVKGLNPQPDKHKFHLTLQKVNENMPFVFSTYLFRNKLYDAFLFQDSGILIDVNARLQINVMINKIPGFEYVICGRLRF